MTNAEIEALAGDALDIAARHIQDTLGVKLILCSYEA